MGKKIKGKGRKQQPVRYQRMRELCALRPYGDHIAAEVVMRKPRADERVRHEQDLPVMTAHMQASMRRASALERGDEVEAPTPHISIPPSEIASMVQHLAECSVEVRGADGLGEGAPFDVALVLWQELSPVTVSKMWALWQTHVACHDQGVSLQSLHDVLKSKE